jgi:hypothetical protein
MTTSLTPEDANDELDAAYRTTYRGYAESIVLTPRESRHSIA